MEEEEEEERVGVSESSMARAQGGERRSQKEGLKSPDWKTRLTW